MLRWFTGGAHHPAAAPVPMPVDRPRANAPLPVENAPPVAIIPDNVLHIGNLPVESLLHVQRNLDAPDQIALYLALSPKFSTARRRQWLDAMPANMPTTYLRIRENRRTGGNALHLPDVHLHPAADDRPGYFLADDIDQRRQTVSRSHFEAVVERIVPAAYFNARLRDAELRTSLSEIPWRRAEQEDLVRVMHSHLAEDSRLTAQLAAYFDELEPQFRATAITQYIAHVNDDAQLRKVLPTLLSLNSNEFDGILPSVLAKCTNSTLDHALLDIFERSNFFDTSLMTIIRHIRDHEVMLRVIPIANSYKSANTEILQHIIANSDHPEVFEATLTQAPPHAKSAVVQSIIDKSDSPEIHAALLPHILKLPDDEFTLRRQQLLEKVNDDFVAATLSGEEWIRKIPEASRFAALENMLQRAEILALNEPRIAETLSSAVIKRSILLPKAERWPFFMGMINGSDGPRTFAALAAALHADHGTPSEIYEGFRLIRERNPDARTLHKLASKISLLPLHHFRTEFDAIRTANRSDAVKLTLADQLPNLASQRLQADAFRILREDTIGSKIPIIEALHHIVWKLQIPEEARAREIRAMQQLTIRLPRIDH